MPEYKVYYFDYTGRAEAIRMLLSYGGIKFEDVRVSREDFLKLKPTLPLGQLPILEIDGKKIPQSVAIGRYLAGIVKLGGNDAKENLKIDIAVDTLGDLQKKVIEYAYEKDEEKKKTIEKTLVNETLPFFLKKFDSYAGENGGFLALDRLSWADIEFIVTYEIMVNAIKKDVLADYPNLAKVKSNVLAVPSLKEWIKKRPQIGMFTYDLRQDL